MEKKEKPEFNVLNFGFRKRVKARWRKPRGTHNKKRMKMAWTGASPKIGYKNPAKLRGIHPSGLPEVLVSNASDLDGLKDVLVRISSATGARKRKEIEEKASSMKLKVLNAKILKKEAKRPKKQKPVKKPAVRKRALSRKKLGKKKTK